MSSFQPQTPNASIRWLPVLNQSDEDIPPFGVMRITGVDDDTDAYTVAKPSASSQVEIFVNGPTTILAGTPGQAHRTEPLQVLYETGDGTPAIGEDWGTKADSWKLHKTVEGESHRGFRPQGATDGNTMLASFFPGSSVESGFLAKITGNTGTTPKKYAWSEGTIDTDGTKSVLSGGRSGTTSDDYLLELNNTTTADNTYVWAYRDPTSGQLWFDKDDTGGGGSLTVQESDGSPSVTATTISFVGSGATGPFTVVDSGSGVATVDIQAASATVRGAVTTSAQHFDGIKSFFIGIIVEPYSATGPDSWIGFNSHIGTYYNSHANTGTDSAFYQGNAQYVMTASAASDTGTNPQRISIGKTNSDGEYPGTTADGRGFYIDMDTSATVFAICGPSAAYAVYDTDSTTLFTGVTGTILGMVVTGGIITTANSPGSVDDVSGTAGGTYTGTEQTIINDLVTQLNALLAELRSSGVLATPP